MSAVNRPPTKSNGTSNRKSMLIIGGIVFVVAGLLFAYLMWYVSPEEYTERVKVIAVTEDGCIAETYDGFAVNIGRCLDKPGEYVLAPIDKKTKERAAAMNPTS